MAKWKVEFQCGTGKVDEVHITEIEVECHWSYNAPKVGFKMLDSVQQGQVEKNCISISVKPA